MISGAMLKSLFVFALSASQLFSQRLKSSTTLCLNILCQLVSVSAFQFSIVSRDFDLSAIMFAQLARCGNVKSVEGVLPKSFCA
jgi:hypothetical protein